MNDCILMENMTWQEIQNAILSGCNSVIFAVSSIEQHGPHLPTSTDAVIGEEVARRVAVRLDKTLVAPTIRPGYAPSNMCFPGTITLQSQTLSMTIRDYCVSLAKFFKNIVVMCAHGGNLPILQLACREVAETLPATNIIPIYGIAVYAPEDEKGLFGREKGFHANRTETSWMLHIRQDLVRKDKIKRDPMQLPKNIIDPSRIFRQGMTSEISSTGVLGDPIGANAEEGRRVIDAIVDNMAREIRLLLR